MTSNAREKIFICCPGWLDFFFVRGQRNFHLHLKWRTHVNTQLTHVDSQKNQTSKNYNINIYRIVVFVHFAIHIFNNLLQALKATYAGYFVILCIKYISDSKLNLYVAHVHWKRVSSALQIKKSNYVFNIQSKYCYFV